MSRATKAITAILVLLWVLLGADIIHAFGRPMSLGPLCWTLSVLIVASLLDGLVVLLNGPGFYKAMRVGEQVGEQRERRRHRCPTAAPTQRAKVTTG